jgi:hypothetical protein
MSPPATPDQAANDSQARAGQLVILIRVFCLRSPVPPDAVTVINPAAMPAGTELSFTYVNHDRVLTGSLIYTAAHTCSPT